MRMWMVNPKHLCQKHLFGEHVEMHMFLASLRDKKGINGYLKNNLFEPLSLQKRHDELADEIVRRGYNHKSPLDVKDKFYKHLTEEQIDKKIDCGCASDDLFGRCTECCKLSREEKNGK